jgi:hypothetical protein
MVAALSVQAQTATGAAGATTTTGAGTTTTVHGGGRVNVQNGQTTPRNFNSGNVPPGRAFDYTNLPPGRPFQNLSTNETSNTNAPYVTNNPYYYPPTNTYGGVTNNPAETNSTTYNPAITNTLAQMSPAQARAVLQFQAGLNALQQIAVNLGGVQNVNQVIQQNPQLQAQLQQIETQIGNLAQGQVKPTTYQVQRLATDLLQSSAQAQLSPSQQLVVAIVINDMANSGTMDPAQVQNAVNTVQANLEGAGVPRSVSHLVTCDLHSIAFQLQPNLQLQ